MTPTTCSTQTVQGPGGQQEGEHGVVYQSGSGSGEMRFCSGECWLLKHMIWTNNQTCKKIFILCLFLAENLHQNICI